MHNITLINLNLSQDSLVKMLLNCMAEFNPDVFQKVLSQSEIASFKYHVERTSGLKLDYYMKEYTQGGFDYELRKVELVDADLFMMWVLRWS